MSCFRKTKLLTEKQKHQFAQELERALNLQESEDGKSTWNCQHDCTYTHTKKILYQMEVPLDTIEKLLEYFSENGGYCDCEIMMNVVCGDETETV